MDIIQKLFVKTIIFSTYIVNDLLILEIFFFISLQE